MLFSRHDTVEIMDPNTFEKKLKVRVAEININECVKSQFVMDLFWDRSKNQLIAKILGVAPICDIENGEEYEYYNKPLFYLLTDKK